MILIAEINILGIRKSILNVSGRAAGKPALESHNALWIFHRQGFQSNGIKCREQSCVHANSQRQGQNCYGGEAWILDEHTRTVTDIAPHCFEPEATARFAAFFLEFFVAAEFDAGSPLCFRARSEEHT